MENQVVNSKYPTSTCTKCKITKPTTRENFGTKPNGKPRSWCRECTRNSTNKYAELNRELGRARARTRKERLETVGVVNEHLAHKDFLLQKQGGLCYFCNVKIDSENTEVDHLTPISRGGTNDINNLAACCRDCNRAKTNKTEKEFRKWRESRLKYYK